MRKITISDATLRDGNHAVQHQLSKEQISLYSRKANEAKIPIVEVGHGNGLGASSLQLGESKCPDLAALQTARESLTESKLSVHVIPGFATIEKDLNQAVSLGVDIFRIASHCTEADLCQKHITYVRQQGKIALGVLMMSHMVSPLSLAEEAKKMASYGASGIIIMDSAGYYLPQDVKERISALKNSIDLPLGFHAHNNLGMAIANSITAVEAGADIIDGCSRGFGAGAGNAQLEVLVAVLHKLGYETGIDFYKLLDLGDLAEKELMDRVPTIKSATIVSGLAGVFSGFLKPVERIAKVYGIDSRELFFELGKRKIIAGQEDFILQIAMELKRR